MISNRDALGRIEATHGETRAGSWSPEYRAWFCMKQRCFNPKSSSYERYGLRGITVHPAWVDNFAAFLSHVGRRPSPSHSLDRIDNECGYVPGNVRWATDREQARNRDVCRKLDARAFEEIKVRLSRGGESQATIARAFGVSPNTISLIHRGVHWRCSTTNIMGP